MSRIFGYIGFGRKPKVSGFVLREHGGRDGVSVITSAEGVYCEGGIVCLFDGRIYSYGDESLPRGSYEEYLCGAYRKYGRDVFNMLEGSFCAAIFDLDAGSALFGRDHFGGRPLYCCFGDDYAAVSTDLSALANCGLREKKLSLAGLCDYFTLRFIPAPDTVFEGIRAMIPGQMAYVSARDGRVSDSMEAYWDVKCDTRGMMADYEQAKALIREKLTEAVDRCTRYADNGVFLSGGIDSTVVAGTAARLLGRRLDSFTVGFKIDALDESPRAKIAADAFGTQHHVYYLDYDEALEQVDKIISGFDQPFADASAIPTWIINKFAADMGVRNVLTGDGSDQIFAGSNKYLIRHYTDRLMKVPKPLRNAAKAAVYALPDSSSAMRKIRKVFACADMDPYEMRRRMLQLCLDNEGLGKLLKDAPIDWNSDSVSEFFRINADVTDELTNTLYVDLKVVADGGMMTKMGSMSRLAGISTHIPFMSKDMLALAFRIPPEFKQKGSAGKVILKDAFSDIIPPELMTASKKGFEAPVCQWFRGPLLPDLQRELSRERVEQMGIFDGDFVRRLIEEHVSMAYDRSYTLWALYVFSKWYRSEFE